MIHLFIGFSIIFTIHFAVAVFLETPICWFSGLWCLCLPSMSSMVEAMQAIDWPARWRAVDVVSPVVIPLWILVFGQKKMALTSWCRSSWFCPWAPLLSKKPWLLELRLGTMRLSWQLFVASKDATVGEFWRLLLWKYRGKATVSNEFFKCNLVKIERDSNILMDFIGSQKRPAIWVCLRIRPSLKKALDSYYQSPFPIQFLNFVTHQKWTYDSYDLWHFFIKLNFQGSVPQPEERDQEEVWSGCLQRRRWRHLAPGKLFWNLGKRGFCFFCFWNAEEKTQFEAFTIGKGKTLINTSHL